MGHALCWLVLPTWDAGGDVGTHLAGRNLIFIFGHLVIRMASQAGTDLKMTSQLWKEASRTVDTDGFIRATSRRFPFEWPPGSFCPVPGLYFLHRREIRNSVS